MVLVTRAMVAIALIAGSLVLGGFTRDDSQPWQTVGEFLPVGAMPLPVDVATSRCLPPPPEACVYKYPILRESCEVDEVKELGRFGDEQYLAVRYLRTRIYDEGQGREPYACANDEVALVAFAGAGAARVVWRDATEREFTYVRTVTLSSYADGTSILAVLYCLNGTGGCAQGMLIWTGVAWQRLERDATWEPIYQNLPAGYRQHKSPEIDFGNLTWEQNLAHDNDANCCPSGKILFDLAIVDHKLSVKSHRFIVPDAK